MSTSTNPVDDDIATEDEWRDVTATDEPELSHADGERVEDDVVGAPEPGLEVEGDE